MSSEGQATVTELLEQVADGNSSAVDRLLPLVYDELRRLAESYLGRERADHRPWSWLRDVLRRIPDITTSRLPELPDRWQPSQAASPPAPGSDATQG